MLKTMNYVDKLILAPMVRIGTLPSRLLALRYGADIVYSEEVIDYRMLRCQRQVNEVLGTVDFSTVDGNCAFRTCAEEKNCVVFQMGTADPERALQVARLVENDVAAIDVNMGCPKDFSVRGGMGAALLTQPEKAAKILSTLVQGVKKPVTCKIRILKSLEETIDLVRVLESTGIAAIAVHGRFKGQRSTEPVNKAVLREICQIAKIPVIANGGSLDFKTHADVEQFRADTGAASVMVARAAEWNPSIFRKDGMLPALTVARDFLALGIRYNVVHANTKYCMAQLLKHELETPCGKRLMAAKHHEEFCDIYDMLDSYKEAEAALEKREQELGKSRFGIPLIVGEPSAKRACLQAEEAEDGTLEMHVKYFARDYQKAPSPKTVLHEWAHRNKLDPPVFNTIQRSRDKAFKSTAVLDGKQYSSSYWEKSKRYAEQATAIVCIQVLNITDSRWQGTKKPPTV